MCIQNVFSESELVEFRRAAEALREAARPDDKESWWGKDDKGAPICTRVLRGGKQSVFRVLPNDPRVQRLFPLMPDGLRPWDPEAVDGVTVIYKTPQMKEGLSDLPWHRDCGMGGHAVMCPANNFSIYLHDATPESGELRFMPGSHTCIYGNEFSGRNLGISVAAKAGSITLHATDVMHMAPPPLSKTGPYRTSVLLLFARHSETHDGGRRYNDVLLGSDDGQIESLDDRLARG